MSPRIPPIQSADALAPEHQAIGKRVEAFFGAVRGPFTVLLRSPVLANQILDVVEDIREQTIVDPQLRLLAILATVRERNSAYVWAAQVRYARGIGLPEAAIDLIRARAGTEGLSEAEREVVDYARELAQTDQVNQARFDALLSRHGARWLVELTASAQFYNTLCGVANAFAVPAPEDGDRLP
jgi:4-carboxymuconolactone decarboxylase